MRVMVDDGARMFHQSGYGALARSIFRSLVSSGRHEIFRMDHKREFDRDIADQDLLLSIPTAKLGDVDVVLRVASPGPFEYPIPTIIYTQHALSVLPPQWVKNLEKADAIIVPGEFDRKVFAEHFKYVHVCHQHVDERAFRSIERWRPEGEDAFTFAFVGSYGYRKGVDHIWEAFSRAFPDPDGPPVHLALHCFNGASGNNMSHLINGARSLPDHIGLSFTNGTLTTPWMNRFYNRVDAVFTFSRGEGWCMPLHEGLLCGKPVIAPDSTAMGEALPDAGVRRVAVHETPIASVTDPFGASMKRAYGVDGAVQWDVDMDDAAAALRDVRNNPEHYRAGAEKGAQFIRDTYNIDTLGTRLDAILDQFGRRMKLG